MKRYRLLVPLALVAILLVSCSQEPQDSPTSSTPVAPPVNLTWETYTYLDYIALLNTLDYDSIVGDITPGQGVIMYGQLPSWPKNCVFGLEVPSTALGPEEDPVHFSLRVPTYASYLAHPEIADQIILRLGPEGVTFTADITIYAIWMPWRPVPANGWESYYLCAEGEDLEHCDLIEEVPATFNPATRRWQLTRSTNHFSDWEFGGKLPPAPPPPPGG